MPVLIVNLLYDGVTGISGDLATDTCDRTTGASTNSSTIEQVTDSIPRPVEGKLMTLANTGLDMTENVS